MNFKTQKRLAAELLGVGKNKIWFDSSHLEEIGKAITRGDIKGLIEERIIKVKKIKRKKKEERLERRKGEGRIKKKIKKGKQEYVKLIRKLRRYLFWLRKNKKISREEYYRLRKFARAGAFKSLRHLKEFVEKK